MGSYSTTLLSQYGLPIAGALVTVVDYDGALPTLANLDDTPKSNPFLTDELGDVSFKATDGRYRIDYRVGGQLIQRDNNIYVGDLLIAVTPDPAHANYYLGLDADGNPAYLPASTGGSGDVNAFAALLASNAGAGLIGATGGVTVQFALNDKASVASVAGKADAATVNAALNLKADTSTVNAALALKADTTALTAGLALKADTTALTAGLATKADATTVATSLALKADTSMGNVSAFQAGTLVLSGTYAARLDTPGSQNELVPSALGTHYIARYNYASRISGTTTANNGSAGAGPVIALEGASAYIGGASMQAVAEVRSDSGVIDVASPAHTNPNAVVNAARMVMLCDGVAAGGNLLNVFASNLVVSNGRQLVGGVLKAAKNYNACGMEIDMFLSTFGESPVPVIGGISGISLVRAGDAHAPKASNNEAAIVIAASAAMQGNGQTAYSGGWYAGINFTSALAPAGIGNPLTTDGSLITVTGAQTVKYGIDLRNLTVTQSYFLTPDTNIGSGSIVLSKANHGIELGALTTANTPYIDFHASGVSGDGDVRISANGGSGTIGSGAMVIQASSFATTGLVRPSTDNAQTLGNASFRWSTGYFATAPVVGSDERIKEQITELGGDWLKFLRAIRPVSYRLKKIDTDPVTETRMVKRQKTKIVIVEDYEVREIDGERVSQLCEKEIEVGVTEEIPSLDIDGKPEMIRCVIRTEPFMARVARQRSNGIVGADGKPVLEYVFDDDGKQLFDEVEQVRRVEEDVPKMVEVPVWEEVEETVEVTPANSQTFERLHIGFVAQEIRAALASSGLETSSDTQQSIWGIFAYDADADLYMLRMEYFIAPLLLGWQDHDQRITALEA